MEGLRFEDLRSFKVQEAINLQNKLQAVTDDFNKATMTELQKKQYDIVAGAIAEGKARADSFEQANKLKLTDEERQKYIDAAVAGTDKLLEKNNELYNQSRSFSTGWTNAFNDYVTNATNAANIASNLFTKFAQGLEDTLVNLVKTGKLNWKDFVTSMGEELLRSQIKQTLASFGTKFGVGGLFGAGGAGAAARGDSVNNPMYVTDIAKAGGFGTGGQAANPTAELPGIVERVRTAISDFTTSVGNFLSEMFNGIGNFISNFTSELGNIISTVGSSLYDILGTIGSTLFDVIGALGSSLFDIIGSLGSSLGDILGSLGGGGGGGGGILSTLFDIGASLFGFANGGVIPNNGPVLVGEKGPEIMFGSQGAAIVPITGGGGSNVTYNINAVDARSFKELIASDPSFLYAVTMQGAKTMPGRI
jgi:phage-related minor tail protein